MAITIPECVLWDSQDSRYDVLHFDRSNLSVEFQDLNNVLDEPDIGLLREWLELFHTDPNAGLEHHPSVIQSRLEVCPAEKTRAQIVLCRHKGKLEGLAVLLPQTNSTAAADDLGPGWTIRGYRLAGDSLLGSSDLEVQRMLVESIATWLGEQKSGFLFLKNLKQPSALHRKLLALTNRGFETFSPDEMVPVCSIQLPQNPHEYWTKFSAKTRNTFRRKEKKLGSIRLDCIHTPEYVEEFLKHVQEITTQESPHDAQFLSTLAKLGLFRSYLLWAGEQPAAFLIGAQFRGRFLCLQTGHATTFARYSPGTVLFLNVLRDLFAVDSPQWIEFEAGQAEHKKLFANQTGEAKDVWLIPPGRKNRWLVAYLTACQQMRQQVRRLLSLADPLAEYVKQFQSRNGQHLPN